MTDPITPERIAELRRLKARADELDRRDGPGTASWEWANAVHELNEAMANAAPALLDEIEKLAERVVALEDEVEGLEGELARVRAGLGIDSLAKPREGE